MCKSGRDSVTTFVPQILNVKSGVLTHFQESFSLLEKVVTDIKFSERVDEATELLSETFKNGGKVISCGNGGSMSDAMHFAEELTGRYRESRKPIPAIAISDSGYISCVANDFGYSEVFARFVEALGNSGDVLFAISTSGNSENVLKAAQKALQKGMKVIALTGNSGGKLSLVCTIEICVPFNGYADHIQEIHIMAIHAIIKGVEERL